MVKILESRKKHNIRGKLKVLWPLLALFGIAVVLFMERTGVSYDENSNMTEEQAEQKEANASVKETVSCLVITDDEDEICNMLLEETRMVLDSMSAAYDMVEAKNIHNTSLDTYDKIVLVVIDLECLGEDIRSVTNWVKAGGSLMNVATFEPNESFSLVAGKTGILENANRYMGITGFSVDEEFMAGGKGKEFVFDEETESSLEVLLKDECQVYIKALETKLPLLWECGYGKGKFVITNQILSGKINRGFITASFSLLDDISAYPVINASAFYLDDFPSPVPSGNGTYINKEYGMDIANFYANVWWKDILKWEEKYNIRHTGMIIEDYSDQVKSPFPEMKSTERFTFYGNMLLNQGGELGFHGYNHMPLCPVGFDYMGLYEGYKPWASQEVMEEAVGELKRFSQELFPEETFQVYVPPSNILSPEGRYALLEACPDLKAIASTYLPGNCAYDQEFEVAADGIVETPRVTAGAVIENYLYLAALSELNFHFVQSHFMHPDDALDEDRGAALGWNKMSSSFEEYLDWVYDAAPNIQNVTGTGMAEAVKIYDQISVRRTKTKKGLRIELGGFTGEASLMVRVNKGQLKEVSGGSMKHITGNLYLLSASSDTIDIMLAP